jgi:VanZ family protein
MTTFLKYQRLTILWALFVLTMCLMPMGNIGESSLFFPGFDKLVHCGFFFVFVVFAENGLIRQNKNFVYTRVLITAIIAIIFGGAIELLQQYVFTWRDGDWADLFADTVGIGMATFSIMVTYTAINHGKS